MKTEIYFYDKKDQVEFERTIREKGYEKVGDCMWVKVYRKGDQEIVLCREY